jgi:hypothetical protein
VVTAVGEAATVYRRPRPPAAALWRDVAVGVAMAIGGLFGTELGRALGMVKDLGIGGVEVYVWSAVIALPLCVRRLYPISVMIAVALLFFLGGRRHEIEVTSNLFVQADLFISIYTAHAWARHRQHLLVVTGVIVVGMFSWMAYGFVKAVHADAIQGSTDALLSPNVSYVVLNTGINIAYFVGALVWGRTAWGNARQRDELERQAAELAEQQEENSRRAVVDERLRISRELHDVVAHHISSIGVQAGGARRVPSTKYRTIHRCNVVRCTPTPAVGEHQLDRHRIAARVLRLTPAVPALVWQLSGGRGRSGVRVGDHGRLLGCFTACPEVLEPICQDEHVVQQGLAKLNRVSGEVTTNRIAGVVRTFVAQHPQGGRPLIQPIV